MAEPLDIEAMAAAVFLAHQKAHYLGWAVKPDHRLRYEELSEASKAVYRASVRAVLSWLDDLPRLRGRSAALAAVETELQACAETSDLAARVRELRVQACRNETEALLAERERTEGALRMVAQLEARLRAVRRMLEDVVEETRPGGRG